MSIRSRLVVMCLVVALLPAIPLTFLVKTLFDKSFDVGLNPTMEEALQSGLTISRGRLEELRDDFHSNVQRVAGELGVSPLDSAVVAAAAGRVSRADAFDGFAVRTIAVTADGTATTKLPGPLRSFASNPVLVNLQKRTSIIDRQSGRPTGYSFFETEDRSVQLAVWNPFEAAALRRSIRPGAADAGPAGGYVVLFFKETDPDFLAHANRLLDGRQIFAELRLLQRSLSRSFFYPFIIIYIVSLLITLGLALLMAERLAEPIRRLAAGANVVAEGDWSYRLEIKAGGETGRLVQAFNGMVARLDAQRRRLIDMEKLATWREMARHLAHEIKNPLLPIRLTIEELKDQYKGDDPRYREMLEESTRVVGDELNNLQTLVKEFSEFARMPEMNPREGSLEQLVRDVSQMYPAVKSTIETRTGLPEFSFDPEQIRRVLINLFDNALSVRAEGRECEVNLVMDRDEEDAVVTFSDNGPGIAPEHLDKIFEPYFTTRSEGTGLGLAMVKKILLLHGGSITASSPGGGAFFEIRLPLFQKEQK